MKRRVFTILSAVSLLLAVAIAGLWVRSYWRHDLAASERAGIGAESVGGVLLIVCISPQTYGTAWHFGTGRHHTPFDWWTFDIDMDRDGLLMRVPHWVVALLNLIVSALSFRFQMSPNRRSARIACSSCGYDLRASKDKCPECGAAISKPAV